MIRVPTACPRAARRILTTACLLCGIGVLAGAGPAAASLPPASFYGLNVQPVFEATPLFMSQSQWAPLFSTVASDHLEVARIDAQWRYVEPNAPVGGVHTYDWSNSDPTKSTDAIVAALAQQGIRVEATLDLPPSWAGGMNTRLDPSHYADFEAFAAAFAARYGDGGSFWSENPGLPYEPVEQFEVWDEANSNNFWIADPDAPTTVMPYAADYMQVLPGVSSAIHAVDPSAQVLASIGWQDAAAYVSELYTLGVKGAIQGIALHPYSPNAPGMLSITAAVRAVLTGAGDGSLPIDVTEAGLPSADPTTATAPYTDGQRAATLTLAGDALAHSDCNVQSYDVYSIVGSGTPIGTTDLGDGSYFGLFDPLSDEPNLTGAAVIAAEQRWRSSPADGLVICGAGTTPSADLLPLGIQLTHTAPTCVSAEVTYEGNPLQAAQLVLLASDNRVDPAQTNENGAASMCVQSGPTITSFTVYAEASSQDTANSLTTPNMALSATYSCGVNAAVACAFESAAPTGGTTSSGSGAAGNNTTSSGSGGGGGSGASGGSASSAAGYRLSARIVKVRAARTTLRVLLAAPAGKRSSVKLRVWLQRHGAHRRTLVKSLPLTADVARTLTARVSLDVGDHLIVAVLADKSAGLAALQTRLLATRRLGARAVTR